MARLFIGLDVPILASFGRLLEQLSRMGPSVRPVRPDALHITLRFLGEVDPQHIQTLAGAIDSAVGEGLDGGWLAPFDLVLTHVGTFPVRQAGQKILSPRVVFAGTNDPGPLPRLSDTLDEHINALGLPVADRDKPMHAHVTLARVKRRRSPDRRVIDAITQMIAEARDDGLGSMRIKAVKLIESRQGAQGSEYIARHTCAFKHG